MPKQKAAPGGASTPTGSLTTRSVYLLMADENPTGRSSAVALTFPADHVRFLRRVFGMARDGIKDELANYPKQLQEPARLRREETAFGRLLMALDELVIVPDCDVRAVLADLAEVIDAENEYVRVVKEHEALYGLLGQVGGRGRRDGS